jgi:chromosome segregation ATPase
MDDNLCDKLEALHQQIHAELDDVQQLDDEKRRRLEHLQADIAAALERCEAEQEPALLARLNEAVDEFELSHPSLTAAIGHVMDVLSRSGI